MATPAGYPANAWWVRMVVTIPGGGSITVPTQHARPVYTANQACVVVDEPDVKGDVDALISITARPVSDQYQAIPGMHRDVDSVIVGLRSTDREPYYANTFNAYINLSDRQNPTWLTPTILDAVTCSWDASEPGSSTGHSLYYTTAGISPMTPSLAIEFNALYAACYYGKYRAFIRYRVAPAHTPNLFVMKLSLMSHLFYGATDSWATLSESQSVLGVATSAWEYFIADMGVISIPGMALDPSNFYDSTTGLNLVISLQALGHTEAWLYDIILIPCDEWICSIELPQYPSIVGKMTAADFSWIDIDSIVMPTELVRCKMYDVSGGAFTSLRTITNGRAIAHPHRAQKYWFLSSRHDGATGPRTCGPDIVLSIWLWRTQRYLTLRGAE
jgi:hypothetical protein